MCSRYTDAQCALCPHWFPECTGEAGVQCLVSVSNFQRGLELSYEKMRHDCGIPRPRRQKSNGVLLLWSACVAVRSTGRVHSFMINGQLIEMIICHHQVNHQIGTHERSATITFRKLDTLIQTCMKRSLAGTPLAVVLSWCGGWVQYIYWIQN